MNKLLITGGAGFIGSHVVRLFVTKYPHLKVYNLDALTYAGNLENLLDIENQPNYQFLHGDITDEGFLMQVFQEHAFDGVIHLAAESHVDRSISNPGAFVKTNVNGTVNLLNAAMSIWKDDFAGKRFYHVSTDEVYGSLGETGFLPKPQHTTLNRLTQRLRRHQTILYVPMPTPMVFRRSLPTAPIITVLISFQRNCFRFVFITLK